MKRLFVPTKGPDDWRRLLAEPDKHWRTGFSAKALAYCWEEGRGFPGEVRSVFARSGFPEFQEVEILFAVPEYEVDLPGGGMPSCNDLFVLAKGNGGLIAIAVEGKVSEPFGPTLEEWGIDSSPGKRERFDFLVKRLGLGRDIPRAIRYQLLHRTASAVIEAVRFNAPSAVILVHSFSPDKVRFGDFEAFCALFGAGVSAEELFPLATLDGVTLFCAWVGGDAK